MGYSPPARKLAVSPESATRFGSARLRAMPFCSSALISTSIVLPPVIMRARAKPNGDAPDSTPAAGILVLLVGAVIGRVAAGWREPILIVEPLLNTFHCKPSSRPAVREI